MTTWLHNFKCLAKRELYSYFCSPIAYIFLVMFLIIIGIFTFGDSLGNFYKLGYADLELPFFTWHPWLFMIFVPAIGMRLWSEELSKGTLELLLTMPINIKQAVLAKYFAGAFMLFLVLFFTTPLIWTVNFLGEPDNGKILSAYLGSFLMAAAFLSISSVCSALTENQVSSFILTLVICLLMILSGFPPILHILREYVAIQLLNLIEQVSIYPHYANFQKGIVSLYDCFYFLAVIIWGLLTTQHILRKK